MIDILDCTLRDGGYYTNWDFDKSLTDNYFQAMEKIPVSYVEIGYRSPVLEGYKGEYNYCPDYVLQNARKQMPSTKIGIMLNEKEIDKDSIDKLLSSAVGFIDFVRMAVDPANLERAGQTALKIKSLGFEVGFNVMYMSKWDSYPGFIDRISSLNGVVDSFSMVDSYGGMLPHEVKALTQSVKSIMKCKVGFHGHNNIELAFANSLAAIEGGCDIVDSTVTGMGRGAGNLRTELILSYFSSKENVSTDFNALSNTVSDFERMKEKYGWGTTLPYMVSGFSSLPQKDVMDWVTRRFYSINSILQALHNMRDKKGDNLKLPAFNSEKEKFDIALIVGGGPRAIKASKAVIQFLDKQKDKKVCIIHASSKNAASYGDSGFHQFFCLVGNEGHRLEKVFDGFNPEMISCVLPPYPRKMGTYIPEKLKDKSFELDDITFSPLYKDSHTALALQTATELSVQTIYITGYDGYEGMADENEQMLTKENEYLFSQFLNENPGIDISAITFTKYKGIKNQSVYGLLTE